MKKQWKKPELIILVRSKSEEAVLTACKGGSMNTGVAPTRGACIDKVKRECLVGCNMVAPS